MINKGLFLAAFLLLLPGFAFVGSVDVGEEFVITELSESAGCEKKCGPYFGCDNIPGTTMKRITFNYETDDNVYFRSVALSTINTEIDGGKPKPTVEFTDSGDIIIKISQNDFDKASECLPPPKEK